jgi:hypothetical protein
MLASQVFGNTSFTDFCKRLLNFAAVVHRDVAARVVLNFVASEFVGKLDVQ